MNTQKLTYFGNKMCFSVDWNYRATDKILTGSDTTKVALSRTGRGPDIAWERNRRSCHPVGAEVGVETDRVSRSGVVVSVSQAVSVAVSVCCTRDRRVAPVCVGPVTRRVFVSVMLPTAMSPRPPTLIVYFPLRPEGKALSLQRLQGLVEFHACVPTTKRILQRGKKDPEPPLFDTITEDIRRAPTANVCQAFSCFLEETYYNIYVVVNKSDCNDERIREGINTGRRGSGSHYRVGDNNSIFQAFRCILVKTYHYIYVVANKSDCNDEGIREGINTGRRGSGSHYRIHFTFLLAQRLEYDTVIDLTPGIWSPGPSEKNQKTGDEEAQNKLHRFDTRDTNSRKHY
ncbi:hypothetical protein J6590_041799 [Homalodisca vitripennis]|nr:hypothetical protein J6590_041799 [Homalodisca vitripennis]